MNFARDRYGFWKQTDPEPIAYNPDYRAGQKTTALMAGASGNHPQIVAALAAAGADLDQRDALGDPALNWASYMGHVEYSRELIVRGVSRFFRRTSNGSSPSSRHILSITRSRLM